MFAQQTFYTLIPLSLSSQPLKRVCMYVCGVGCVWCACVCIWCVCGVCLCAFAFDRMFFSMFSDFFPGK